MFNFLFAVYKERLSSLRARAATDEDGSSKNKIEIKVELDPLGGVENCEDFP